MVKILHEPPAVREWDQTLLRAWPGFEQWEMSTAAASRALAPAESK